ncbi:uncharacterized protein B0I36DRAFT_366380 [Microdochium trichocladiopsis]|uniref:Endonuclease/exonuclease/phosphatase domain-containing protein n=1 Tax=Microdochium trichocladiopsis TaxID=1682393 RepID=A0A9P8XYI6_9PEZI|nr:uncharacterized protein B0I36DRAFT_366380 [Microdochium trichocladiopsis]KAH7024435.1 hypothetical protein B0I36DRAFT_366380 [Microdochium trichocladiopsis]
MSPMKTTAKHPWTRGKLYDQPYYAFSMKTRTWEPVGTAPARDETEPGLLGRLEVLSWNMDWTMPERLDRTKAIFEELHAHVERAARKLGMELPAANAAGGPAEHGRAAAIRALNIVIMLNEVVEWSIGRLKSLDWVRKHFYLTDINTSFWGCGLQGEGQYGTCILIPKTLLISSVGRIHYTASNCNHDALFVDISVVPAGNSASRLRRQRTLRLCSTQLDPYSYVLDDDRRKQLAEAAAHMHIADLAILGGDLKAVCAADRSLHSEQRLLDVYFECGGVEGYGATWGPTAGKKRRALNGMARADKVLFCGEGLFAKKFETYGHNIEVEDQEARSKLKNALQMDKGWVSEHLLIKATFIITPAQ